jgi:catechol 2,3-dioxygenase-like lactoylglutathione lyase family enzyme
MGEAAPPPLTRIPHVALTVSDVDASVAWYQRVLGCRRLVTAPHDGVVLDVPGGGGRLVLHHHDRNDGARFDPTVTGLDHVSLEVADRAALDTWAARLVAMGVDHDPVRHLPDFGKWVLVLRDPDGIPLELITS